MKKNTYNEREIRLECLKLAATTAMQLKTKPGEVLNLARQYLAFVIEADHALVDQSDGHRISTPAHAGSTPAERAYGPSNLR